MILEKKWYYGRNGATFGPVSAQEIMGFVAEKYLQPTDLVWTQGMADWVAVHLAFDLGHPAPPPLPQPQPAPAAPIGTLYGERAAPPVGTDGFAAPYVSFGQAISICLNKYAVFRGRASRSEFWWFWLFNVALSFAVSFVFAFADGFNGTEGQAAKTADVLNGLITLALFLPNLAVQVRRLHDTGRSGWWIGGLWLGMLGLVVLAAVAFEGRDSGAPFWAVIFGAGVLGWIGVAITIFVFTLQRGTPGRNVYDT